jgi:hypothetical protein
MRGIEQRIRFKDPALGQAKSGGAQQTAARGGIRQRQLDLDFAWTTRMRYNFLPKIA